jgi:hypothetical protein
MCVVQGNILLLLVALYIINVFFFFQLRKLAYAIKRSTTILLPRWNEILHELATATALTDKKPLPVRIMPRDVSTRWNSTYEMLKFAYSYREAIDKITGERAMKLRDYELLESEWETVKQLRDSLKVRTIYFFHYSTELLTIHSRSSSKLRSNSQQIPLLLLPLFQRWTKCIPSSRLLWRK